MTVVFLCNVNRMIAICIVLNLTVIAISHEVTGEENDIEQHKFKNYSFQIVLSVLSLGLNILMAALLTWS